LQLDYYNYDNRLVIQRTIRFEIMDTLYFIITSAQLQHILK